MIARPTKRADSIAIKAQAIGSKAGTGFWVLGADFRSGLAGRRVGIAGGKQTGGQRVVAYQLGSFAWLSKIRGGSLLAGIRG
jgi:hypothetical protein